MSGELDAALLKLGALSEKDACTMRPYHMADCRFDDGTYLNSETIIPETF